MFRIRNTLIPSATFGSSYFWFSDKQLMVKLKFVVKDNTLVLRISEGKERFYRSAMSILIGKPNIQRHWNAEKERFINTAVSSKECRKFAVSNFILTFVKIELYG